MKTITFVTMNETDAFCQLIAREKRHVLDFMQLDACSFNTVSVHNSQLPHINYRE